MQPMAFAEDCPRYFQNEQGDLTQGKTEMNILFLLGIAILAVFPRVYGRRKAMISKYVKVAATEVIR